MRYQTRGLSDTLLSLYRPILPSLFLAALLLSTALPTHAHNGSVAIGMPVSGITVDGDHSDWPDDLPRYPIELVNVLVPDSPEDLTASFRVGYDDEAIYVAVDIVDDSIVLEPGGAWNTRDGCELYVDFDHEGPQSPLQLVVFGGNPLNQGADRGIRVEVTSDEHHRAYEWRVPLPVGNDRWRVGQTIGLDVVIEDVDASHGQYTYQSWGSFTTKFSNSYRVGDLILAPGPLGSVDGQLLWEDSGEPAERSLVHVFSGERSAATVETDRKGRFRVDLPPGDYLALADSHQTGHSLTIAAGHTTTLDLTKPAPRFVDVPLGERGPFRRLPYSLPVNMYLHADRRGGVWIAAQQYLAHYDGRQIVNRDVAEVVHPQLTCVVEDSSGHVWFGTLGGLSRYDGETFEHYDVGLPDNLVTDMAVDQQGVLWITTPGGLARYDGGFTYWDHSSDLPSTRLLTVTVDHDDRVWFGSEAGHLGYVYEDQIVVVDFFEGGVWDLAVDAAGTLWVALGRTGEVVRYRDNQVEYVTAADGLPPLQVNKVFAERDGAVWFLGRGAIRYDDGVYTSFTEEEMDLRPGEVVAATQDASGRVWLSARGEISIYSGNVFSVLHYAASPDSLLITWPIVEAADGVLWMPRRDHLLRYDGTTAQQLELPITEPNLPGEVLIDAANRMWIILNGRSEIWLIDGDHRRRFSGASGLPGYPIDIEPDRDGSLWVATYLGVSRLMEDRFETLDLRDGLPEGIVTNIHPDTEGNLWIGTTRGLSRYDGEGFTNYAVDDGLPDDFVTSLHQGLDGSIWIGTRGGATRFDGEDFELFTTEQGLLSDEITDVDVDRSGNVWFSTPVGVSRYDGKTLQHLTQEDGLPGPSVASVYQDSRGDYWIQSEYGLTRYRPGSSAPGAQITNVLADERYGDVSSVSFPTTQPFLVVEFEGYSDAMQMDRLVYAYRLVGHTDEWQQTSDQRIEYRDLPRGSYTFELQAVDRDHNYSETVTVAVTVHWPYERLAWMSALALALCLGAWQTVRVLRRDRRLTEQNDELLVEAALERVRSRALAMQSPDEIGDLVTALFTEFRSLGFDQGWTSLSLIHEDDTQIDTWASVGWRQGEERTIVDSLPVREDMWNADDPWWRHQGEFMQAWRRGDTHYGYELDRQIRPAFFRTSFIENGADEEEADRRVASFQTAYDIDTMFGFMLFHRYGILNISSQTPFDDDRLAIARRFADLFEFAWSRRLELQQKEERSEQLGVESASARIRAEAMAMESTPDMRRVAGLVAHEFKALDVPTQGCMIYLLDEEQQVVHWYLAYNDLDALEIPYDTSRTLRLPTGTVVGYRQLTLSEELSQDQERALSDMRSRGTTIKQFDEQSLAWMRDHAVLHDMLGMENTVENLDALSEGEGTIRVSAYWGRGMIGTRSNQITLDDAPRVESILVAFSDALALGFQRFQDFEQLEQASLNKSQFLRRMSHDLRSPMNAIIGYSRLLRRRLRDKIGERDERNLANIETSSGNLLNLINDILDLSRIEAGRIELNEQPVDVQQLAHECADALESIVRENVVLHRDLDDVGVINSDPDRLRQVVMNLLGNATKFTEQGSITLTLKRMDDAVEIAVADTGIGIPADDLPHIFDEFRQVERQGGEGAEGTGLGLAIAKKTVDLLGGQISATSEVGVGTTFTVRLGSS